MKNEEQALDDPTQVRRHDDTIRVSFWYPRSPGNVRQIEIDLCDVRAADSIRVHYDFDRDGYVIEQNAYEIDGSEATDLNDWQEVAFIKAWARERAR